MTSSSLNRRHRWRWKFGAAALLGVGTMAIAAPAFAQDAEVDPVQVNLDNVWVLLAAVLVIFMQAGFALVEAGLTRAKSVANIMMKNLIDFCAGARRVPRRRLRHRLRRQLRRLRQVLRRRRLLPRRRRVHLRQPHGAGVLHVPGRVRGHGGHDRVGRDGRADEVQGLPDLQLRHQPVHLPGRRALAVGRRLAVPGLGAPDAVPRLRRLEHRAHGRRRRRRSGAPSSSGPASASTDRTASRGPSSATTSRSPSSAASSSWSAGTASTPAPSSPPTRAIGGIAVTTTAAGAHGCARPRWRPCGSRPASPTSA